MLRELAWRARERVGRLRWRLGLMPVPSHALAFSMAYNQFGAYCIPNTAKNRPAPKRLFAGSVWERSTIEYTLLQIAPTAMSYRPERFLGSFLPAHIERYCPGCHVMGVGTGNPESYRCAAITGLINDLQNLKLFNAALGERCGKDELIISDFEGRALAGVSQLKGIVDKDGVRGEQAVPVQVLAIDEVVPSSSRVSVVQLDVEGGEDAALTGAMATIERSRPVLIVETLPRESIWLCKELFKLGYRIDCKLRSANPALPKSCEPLIAKLVIPCTLMGGRTTTAVRRSPMMVGSMSGERPGMFGTSIAAEVGRNAGCRTGLALADQSVADFARHGCGAEGAPRVSEKV